MCYVSYPTWLPALVAKDTGLDIDLGISRNKYKISYADGSVGGWVNILDVTRGKRRKFYLFREISILTSKARNS